MCAPVVGVGDPCRGVGGGGVDAGGGGLRDLADLGEQLLGRVVPQLCQCQAHAQVHAQHAGPGSAEDHVVDRLAQVQDIIAGGSRATTHEGGLLPEVF